MMATLAASSGVITPCATRRPCSVRPPSKAARGRLSCRSYAADTRTPATFAADRRTFLIAGLICGLSVSNAWPMAAAGLTPCDDYKTAPNGIQFCETKEGTGPSPTKGSMIRAHYTGRLASNGKVFDSSYERRRPLNFKVGMREVIQGWDLGILGTDGLPPMKEGGKRRLVIPAELAYGSRGAGGVIPPNAALIFDVELLGKQ